jgi:hypothetical protein
VAGPLHPELEDPRWLARRWTAGADAEAIAAELDCDPVAARLALIRHGYMLPKGRRRSTIRDRTAADLDERLADADWLRHRYTVEGATVRAIADELDCTEVDVRNALVAADVRQRRPRKG